jgi:hypothetical protein
MIVIVLLSDALFEMIENRILLLLGMSVDILTSMTIPFGFDPRGVLPRERRALRMFIRQQSLKSYCEALRPYAQ